MTILYKQFNSGIAIFVAPRLFVWRQKIGWSLRFLGGALIAGWSLNGLYQWSWGVPANQLGPVWVGLGPVQLRAPWLALVAIAQVGDDAPVLAVPGIIAALVVGASGLGLAALLAGLAGPSGQVPRRGDWLALGRACSEVRREQRELRPGGNGGTIVIGREPVRAWHRMPSVGRHMLSRDWLAARDLGGDRLFLGDSPTIAAAVRAALRSFDGAIIRLSGGPKPLPVGYPGEEVRVMLGRDLAPDPLRQVRKGPMAWDDIQAMVASLHLGDQPSLLAASVWAMALETLPEPDRDMAGLIRLFDDPGLAYQKLGGWFAITTLIAEDARKPVEDLLALWRKCQPMLGDDCEAVGKALTSLMTGHRHWGGPKVRLMDLVQAGPRVISVEAGEPEARCGRSQLTAMLLDQLLRELADPVTPFPSRPVLIAIDPDCGTCLLIVLQRWRARLRARGICLLLHARDQKQVRKILGLSLSDPVTSQVSTLVTERGSAADVFHRMGYADQAFELVRPGELIVATTGRQIMRLAPIDPEQVPVAALAAINKLPAYLAPWNAPAITAPSGAPLPPPPAIVIAPVKRPRTVIVMPDGREFAQDVQDTDRAPAKARYRRPTSEPSQMTTPPAPKLEREFASSTRRLREALARRGSLPARPPSSRKI